MSSDDKKTTSKKTSTKLSVEDTALFISQIGQAIKTLRLMKKKKQHELAADVRLTTRHFQKIESGQIDIKSSTVLAISQALNILPCSIVGCQKIKEVESCGLVCPSDAFDFLPTGAMIFDTKGEIAYLNQKARQFSLLRDWKKSEKSLFVWDFIDDQSKAEELKNYIQMLVKDQPLPTPYHGKASNGGPFIPIRVDWNYILDEDKQVTGFISLITIHPSWV